MPGKQYIYMYKFLGMVSVLMISQFWGCLILFRYSGDWSRIGVVSEESEELLKSAAFLVVPFCFFLVFSFSKKLED